MGNAHTTGALPPAECAWQMGKTAASIVFVNTAMRYVAENGHHPKIDALIAQVEKIKRGDVVLTAHASPEEFLSSLP